MTIDSKLYVVVRRDLKPGPQASQMLHAARQFAHEYPETEQEWFEKSNTIVLLSVADERELYLLQDKACHLGIKFSDFTEPFYKNKVTAIAFEPGEKSSALLRGLPLAYRELLTTSPCSSPAEQVPLKNRVVGSVPTRGATFFSFLRRLFSFGRNP